MMPTNFEVYSIELIGIEALWEIILSAPNEEIYQKSSSFLSKIYKSMQQKEDIKEFIYQNCME
jgi:uncharacterized lipoprotein YajG